MVLYYAVPGEYKAAEPVALEAARSSSRVSCRGGAQRAGLSPWECRAAQSRQACPEEAQEPSWGAAAKAAL